jgi:hypothetical protein
MNFMLKRSFSGTKDYRLGTAWTIERNDSIKNNEKNLSFRIR